MDTESTLIGNYCSYAMSVIIVHMIMYMYIAFSCNSILVLSLNYYNETCLSGHLNKVVTFLMQPRARGPELSQ